MEKHMPPPPPSDFVPPPPPPGFIPAPPPPYPNEQPSTQQNRTSTYQKR